jgi:hypothetical protein
MSFDVDRYAIVREQALKQLDAFALGFIAGQATVATTDAAKKALAQKWKRVAKSAPKPRRLRRRRA